MNNIDINSINLSRIMENAPAVINHENYDLKTLHRFLNGPTYENAMKYLKSAERWFNMNLHETVLQWYEDNKQKYHGIDIINKNNKYGLNDNWVDVIIFHRAIHLYSEYWHKSLYLVDEDININTDITFYEANALVKAYDNGIKSISDDDYNCLSTAICKIALSLNH